MFKPPGDCPVCGEYVPRKAVACPECGACERSGWNEEDSIYDGLDLPEEAYEDQPRQGRAVRRATFETPFWWWVAAVLLLIFFLGLIAR